MANRKYNLRIGRWFNRALATKVKLGYAPNFFVMKLQISSKLIKVYEKM